MAKKVQSYTFDDDDSLVISVETEADGDWLKAAWLKKKGTPEALEELRKMENSQLEILDDEE